MTKPKQKPIVLDTDIALQLARKILTEFHNKESFDNVKIEQYIQEGRNDNPYCKITIEFSSLNHDQILLLDDILKEHKSLQIEIRDSDIMIFALSDEMEA